MNRKCGMRRRDVVLFGTLAALVTVAWVPMVGQTPRSAGSTVASTKPFTPPRTAWGDPDLQGTWRDLTEVPFERPKGAAEFRTDAEIAAMEQKAEERRAKVRAGEYEIVFERGLPLRNAVWYQSDDRLRISRRTSAIIDPPNGRVPPWTPQQLKRWEAREVAKRGHGANDSWEDRSPIERCIATVESSQVGYYGLIRPPREAVRVEKDEYKGEIKGYGEVKGTEISTGTGVAGDSGWQLIQAPGYVVIVAEGNNQGVYRIIPLDGRPQLGPKIRQWRGDARGHWEGNTLVVEITNINDQQNGGSLIPSQTTAVFPGSGETLRVIERYTRVSADTVEYRATIDDPETYTRPYTVLHEWTLDDKFFMPPGQCQEGNAGMVGLLMSGRADEQWALDYAAAEQVNRQRRLEEMKAEWAAASKESR